MAKYGAKASAKVERAVHEMKEGSLKIGRSNKPVKSRAQAIAIGLSEARQEGGKVPKKTAPKKPAKKTIAKNNGVKKPAVKKTAAKKAPARRTAAKKIASKKVASKKTAASKGPARHKAAP